MSIGTRQSSWNGFPPLFLTCSKLLNNLVLSTVGWGKAMGKRSMVKCLMTIASLFKFKFHFWAFEGFCCFQTCLSSYVCHIRKVFRHFRALKTRRRKQRGVNHWDAVLKKSNNTFLHRMPFLWSPVKDNVWKRAQKAVISSPILDYFWRATCCISHCTNQKSCQGLLHTYSACFTGTINYSCRVCLCQFTCISWAHP